MWSIFLSTPNEEPNEPPVPPVYAAIEAVSTKDLLQFRAQSLPLEIVSMVKTSFQTVQDFYFQARAVVSFSAILDQHKGASIAMYHTVAGVAMLVKSNNCQLFHVQAVQKAAAVIVSAVVTGSLKYVRVYSVTPRYMTTLSAKDKSVFGVLYHVACSLTRPSNEPGATVYIPNADVPSMVGVSVQDFSFTEVVTSFIGNRFMVPGIEMVNTQSQSETTRIVQTRTNSGILLLMRGSLMLAGLCVSKVDAKEIMGVYTDHAEAQVRTDGWHVPVANGLVSISRYLPDQEARSQDLIDFYKMAAYMDTKALQGNDFGPVFESLKEAMEHLTVQLGVEEYEMLKQI